MRGWKFPYGSPGCLRPCLHYRLEKMPITRNNKVGRLDYSNDMKNMNVEVSVWSVSKEDGGAQLSAESGHCLWV